MPSRIWGTVIAGVHFFSPQAFGHQEPGRDEREGLMMVPTTPCAHFVIGQAGFSLRAPKTLLNPMRRLAHAGELVPLCANMRETLACQSITVEGMEVSGHGNDVDSR